VEAGFPFENAISAKSQSMFSFNLKLHML